MRKKIAHTFACGGKIEKILKFSTEYIIKMNQNLASPKVVLNINKASPRKPRARL